MAGFGYPSDTLLPGMKLGWDLKTGLQPCLRSWRVADDSSLGNFTYRLDNNVLPRLSIYRGSVKMTCTGPWNGAYFGAVAALPNFMNQFLVHNEDKIYYRQVLILRQSNHDDKTQPIR